MSYSEKKRSEQNDKKIQNLKTQLFGKEASVKFSYSLPSSSDIINIPRESNTQELTFLHQDLFKSFILALIIIAVQLILALGKNKGFLPFN